MQSQLEIYHARKALPGRLQLSMRTIDRLMAEGELPYIKIGHRVIVKDSDATALLEKHRRSFAPSASKGRRKAA